MQDLHSITVNGRLFGDRRLRHQNNNNNQTTTLKCPRCESSNTKFCYYNNYNLSQPRHFCKNCRRYWTNGGVLRNVPVGGGCRKSNTKYHHQQQQQQRKPSKPPYKKHSSPLSNYSNNTISGPSQLGNFMDGTNNNGNGLEGDNNTVVSFSEFIMGSGDLTVRIEDLIDDHYHPTVENNEGQVQGLFDFSTSTSSTSVVDDHHAFWTSSQQDLSHWGLNNTTSINDLPLFLP